MTHNVPTLNRTRTGKAAGFLAATLAAALLAACQPSPAWSQTPSANDYFEGCQIAASLGATGDSSALSVSQQLVTSACLGFVDGANSAISTLHGDLDSGDMSYRFYCADRLPSNYDVLTIWVGYLQAYPIQLSDDAFSTLLRAMQDTYPCP